MYTHKILRVVFRDSKSQRSAQWQLERATPYRPRKRIWLNWTCRYPRCMTWQLQLKVRSIDLSIAASGECVYAYLLVDAQEVRTKAWRLTGLPMQKPHLNLQIPKSVLSKYTVPKELMGDWYHGQVPPTRISPMIDSGDNTNTSGFFPTILPPGQSISPSRFPVEPGLFPLSLSFSSFSPNPSFLIPFLSHFIHHTPFTLSSTPQSVFAFFLVPVLGFIPPS